MDDYEIGWWMGYVLGKKKAHVVEIEIEIECRVHYGFFNGIY